MMVRAKQKQVFQTVVVRVAINMVNGDRHFPGYRIALVPAAGFTAFAARFNQVAANAA